MKVASLEANCRIVTTVYSDLNPHQTVQGGVEIRREYEQ